MFKVNNRNTRTRWEICSKLIITALCSSVSTVNFEQVNAGCVLSHLITVNHFNSFSMKFQLIMYSQVAFICSESTIENSEHCVDSV